MSFELGVLRVLSKGERIGDWIVDETLGEGGMGAVFRCHNVLSDKILAAVKVLKQHGLGKGRERFMREVELLASVQHPAVVRVLGGGEDTERGLLYMAMEYLEGEELTDVLKRRGALPWDEACRIFQQLGAGLLAAHEKGVVHRDIKPQNVLICTDGTAKLLDFGIAVQTGGEKLTREGQIPGTVAYMAPEVFKGQRPDHRADIYALGLMLWESLTGQDAYPDDPTTTQQQNVVRIMGEKLQAAPKDPGPDYPPQVRDLVTKATEPETERRLGDLAVFVKVLDRRTDPTMAVDFRDDDGWREVGGRPEKKGGGKGWILAIVAVLGIVGVGVALVAVIVAGGVGAVLFTRPVPDQPKMASLEVDEPMAVASAAPVEAAAADLGAEPVASSTAARPEPVAATTAPAPGATSAPVAAPAPAGTTAPAPAEAPAPAVGGWGGYRPPPASVPKGFPFEVTSDANVLSGAKTTSGGSTSWYVSFTTGQDPATLADHYEGIFKGRGLSTVRSETEDGTGLTIAVAGWQASETATFSVGPTYGLGSGHLVSLTWSPL